MPTVFLTEVIHDDAIALLRGAGCQIVQGWQIVDWPAALAGSQAIVTRIAPVGAEVIAAAPALRIIAKHGVGVDNIDLSAAAARGIAVANTPGANAGPVAEHSLMLLLALSRQAVAMDRVARDAFSGRDLLSPGDLEGRRVLVLGFGAIGQRVARLYAALGMEVTIWHRRLGAAQAGYRVVRDLGAALPQAQVLSIHLPLNAGTQGLIGEAELAALPDGAFVINTGRGGVVDEIALAAAAPRLSGVGVDVFEHEPPPPDHPLLQAPNTLLSPHAAALSPAGFRSMGMMAAQNIVDFFAGRLDPAHRVALPQASAAQ